MNRLHREGGCDDCKGMPGTNPDGSIRHHYALTEAEVADGFDAFYSGPITGTFAVDGVEYDTTPPVLPVKREHVAELGWQVHKAHHARGNFLDVPLPGDGSLAAFKQSLVTDSAPEGDTDTAPTPTQ